MGAGRAVLPVLPVLPLPPVLPHRVDDHRAIHAMTVARVLAKERRRRIVRAHGDETVVASQPPPPVRRVPLQAAADVAGQEGFRTRHAELGSFVHRQAADAAGRVRHHGASRHRRHNHVAVVGKPVGLTGQFEVADGHRLDSALSAIPAVPATSPSTPTNLVML